jgi:hypothetical protein
VSVQINIWGNDNEVYVSAAAIEEVLFCQGRSHFQKGSFLRSWYRRLIEIAARVPVFVGNGVAAIVVAGLSLLGQG